MNGLHALTIFIPMMQNQKQGKLMNRFNNQTSVHKSCEINMDSLETNQASMVGNSRNHQFPERFGANLFTRNPTKRLDFTRIPVTISQQMQLTLPYVLQFMFQSYERSCEKVTPLCKEHCIMNW
jgi:hypothetical protein